jgi:hypothetical protein
VRDKKPTKIASAGVRYEVIGSFAPTGENAIEQAVRKLKTVLDGAEILRSATLSDASRYLLAMGIYNGFYSCFETIMQNKKDSPERTAMARWKSENAAMDNDIEASYRVFRNLMTHQGHYISGSIVVWEDLDYHDTVIPVRKFPDFLAKKVNGAVVETYTLYEWVKICYDKIYCALNGMEAIRRNITQADEI